MARPSNSKIKNDLMRERLARGALSLFRDVGSEGLTLRKLADAIGSSHTLLYRYFKNKNALLDAVQEESLNVLYSMLHDADSPQQPPLKRMRIAAQTMKEFSVCYPKEYRFLFSAQSPELAQNKSSLALRHKVFNHIVAIAEEAEKQNLIATEARTWVHVVWATLHGLLSLNEDNQLLEDRSFDDLFNSALGLLFGKAKDS